MIVPPTLFAVHIADAMLGLPWLLAGWLVIAVLVAIASWRIGEDEIPRVALLTAAFFVASSIHIKVGPTSVHLLLGGLVGVILGRRAPLAILIGITLQALLLAHGGVTAIGVNAAVQALPALAAGGLFGLVRHWTAGAATGPRLLVIATAALAWGVCLLLGVIALVVNPWRDLVRISTGAGVVVSLERIDRLTHLATHPLALGLLGGFVLLCVVAAYRTHLPPEFAAGTLAGLVGVVGTLLLAGAVLIFDGADRWGTFVSVVFVAHLPLALVEAGIVGVTAGFLARVQPEMIGIAAPEPALIDKRPAVEATLGPSVPPLLALVVLLLSGSDVWAHRLKAEATVDRKAKRVNVESFYETNDSPREAVAKVRRADGTILYEGPVDEHGNFAFTYGRPEALRIEISAPGGHRAEIRLTAEELGGPDASVPVRSESVASEAEGGTRWRDLLTGLSFVLALAAFWISLRNSRTLRGLQRQGPN